MARASHSLLSCKDSLGFSKPSLGGKGEEMDERMRSLIDSWAQEAKMGVMGCHHMSVRMVALPQVHDLISKVLQGTCTEKLNFDLVWHMY